MHCSIAVHTDNGEGLSGAKKPGPGPKNQSGAVEAAFFGPRAPFGGVAKGARNGFSPVHERITTALKGALAPTAV